MLQYPCFKRCFEPIDMFVAIVPDHLTCRLQLNSTSMHVSLELHLPTDMFESVATNKHICSCVAEPTGIHVTLASDPQTCT